LAQISLFCGGPVTLSRFSLRAFLVCRDSRLQAGCGDGRVPVHVLVQVVVGQVVTVKPGCGLWLAQRRERRPDLLREQSGLFPGGEVAALGGLVEVDEVGVDLLGPGARGLEDLTGEDGEGDREL